MVGAAWLLLFFLTSVVTSLAAGGVWGECALPYRGMHPVPGGPGARTIPYHLQLQRRVGTGSWMDWLNWLAGIALRAGLFFLVLMGGLVLVPRSWEDCGLILSLNLLMALAGFSAVAIPRLLITALGRRRTARFTRSTRARRSRRGTTHSGLARPPAGPPVAGCAPALPAARPHGRPPANLRR